MFQVGSNNVIIKLLPSQFNLLDTVESCIVLVNDMHHLKCVQNSVELIS